MLGKYQMKIQQPWIGYSFAGPSILQVESHISNILIKFLHYAKNKACLTQVFDAIILLNIELIKAPSWRVPRK